jgi:hypothetical protein
MYPLFEKIRASNRNCGENSSRICGGRQLATTCMKSGSTSDPSSNKRKFVALEAVRGISQDGEKEPPLRAGVPATKSSEVSH